jgi:hypothetical protein
MTQTINLGPEVYVTDPCYSVPTWCQTKLTNVLPGEWVVSMIYDEHGGSNRNAELFLIHKDHQTAKDLSYDWFGDFGVDSGQAGVFDAASYRSDSAAEAINPPWIDFVLPGRDQEGDAWYEKICKFTLGESGWGAYDAGAVSRSGWGDGLYPVYGAEVKRKWWQFWKPETQIVALQLVFIDQSAEDDDESDCCNECGAELESDGSCNYCEHFENSKIED